MCNLPPDTQSRFGIRNILTFLGSWPLRCFAPVVSSPHLCTVLQGHLSLCKSNFYFFSFKPVRQYIDIQSLCEMRFDSHIMAFSIISADIIRVKRTPFPNHPLKSLAFYYIHLSEKVSSLPTVSMTGSKVLKSVF